jgi:hypothetical protein
MADRPITRSDFLHAEAFYSTSPDGQYDDVALLVLSKVNRLYDLGYDAERVLEMLEEIIEAIRKGHLHGVDIYGLNLRSRTLTTLTQGGE